MSVSEYPYACCLYFSVILSISKKLKGELLWKIIRKTNSWQLILLKGINKELVLKQLVNQLSGNDKEELLEALKNH